MCISWHGTYGGGWRGLEEHFGGGWRGLEEDFGGGWRGPEEQMIFCDLLQIIQTARNNGYERSCWGD